jgi:hypothetical protein
MKINCILFLVKNLSKNLNDMTPKQSGKTISSQDVSYKRQAKALLRAVNLLRTDPKVCIKG